MAHQSRPQPASKSANQQHAQQTQPAKPNGNGQHAPQAAQTAPASEPQSAEEANAALFQKILQKQHEFKPLGESESITLSPWHVINFIATPSRSGRLPTVQDALKFTIMCRQRQLNPYAGDCYLLGYDSNDGTTKWSIITSIAALLSRAELNKAFEGIQSGVIVQYTETTEDGKTINKFDEREGDLVYEGETLLGGWSKVFRADRKVPFYQRLKLSTYNKGTPQWQKDGAGMIVKCAQSAALREAFPTVLGGLYLKDEIEAFTVAAGSARAPQTGAGGHYTLDALSGKLPADIGPSPGHEPAAGDHSGEGDPGIDQTTADSEPSQQLEGSEATGQATGGTEAAGNGAESGPEPAGDFDPEAELTNWQYDIEQTKTNGQLDQLAEQAAETWPQIKMKVLDMIAKQRTKLAGGNKATPPSKQNKLPGA